MAYKSRWINQPKCILVTLTPMNHFVALCTINLHEAETERLTADERNTF